MKVHFNFPRKLGSVMYSKGSHEVPDEFKDHWFFKNMLKTNEAHILLETAPATLGALISGDGPPAPDAATLKDIKLKQAKAAKKAASGEDEEAPKGRAAPQSQRAS